MYDDTEKFWSDLVSKLMKDLGAIGCGPADADATTFHNRIWETVSEAFRRGQKCANGFHRGNPLNK